MGGVHFGLLTTTISTTKHASIYKDPNRGNFEGMRKLRYIPDQELMQKDLKHDPG